MASLIKKPKKPTPRNKFESRIKAFLSQQKVIHEYESQSFPYVIEGRYTPDFPITTPTTSFYLETKGFFRQADRRKMVAVKKANPTLDIRFLFYPDRKGKTKPEYLRWCKKYGFPWAIGDIPEAWLI